MNNKPTKVRKLCSHFLIFPSASSEAFFLFFLKIKNIHKKVINKM